MALPSWWGNEGKVQNARSKKQENLRAKQTGGKVQAGSGTSWRAPGDVKNAEFLEEMKFTDKDSFALKVETWKKIKRQAAVTGREPKMVIDFPQYDLRLIVTEEVWTDGV